MQVVRLADPDEVAHLAAELIVESVRNGAWRLGVATGSTPIPTYCELIERQHRGDADLRHCHLILLDEYLGLPPDHPASYRTTIRRHLAEPADIPATNVHVPRLDNGSPHTADVFTGEIRTLGGVDLQILGIGRNGHIGFNEPGAAPTSRTRAVELADTTRADNARFFDRPDEVPTRAVTRGLADIHEARSILLLATGSAKAPVVYRLLDERDDDLPASHIHTHPNVTVIVDEPAASML